MKHDRTQSSFTLRSQLILSRMLSWWKLEKSFTRKYMRRFDLLRRFRWKTIEWKNWVQKLLEVVKTPNTQPKTKNPNVRTGRLLSEQRSRSSVQEIENVSYLAAKAPMKEQGDLFSSCVPVSVERLDQDEDADENVDADHVRTVRPVESGQPTGLFTQREETDIDCRVSALPHAVVKHAENFSVRELVKKIQSHPHRQTLQADLQQNNAYNPFSEESKVMIREMGNVEVCSSYAKQFPKCNAENAFFVGIKELSSCTCGHLLKESEYSQSFHQWRLDSFSIQNYVIKKWRPRGARHGETEAQKEHFIAHNERRRCLKKKFEGIHDRSQRNSTYRDSQLKIGWTEEKCAPIWTNWHKENHSCCPPSEEFERYQKFCFFTLNKSFRNAPMKLRSDFWEALRNMHRLHLASGLNQILLISTTGGIRRPLHPVPHGVSGMNAGGAHNWRKSITSELGEWAASKNREICFGRLLIMILRVEFLTSIFFICCSQIVYIWWQSAADDGKCEQNTLTRHIFSHLHALVTVSHTTLAQGCPDHVIHASCAMFCSDLSSTVHFALSLIFLLILSHSHLHLHLPCGLVRGEVHSALPRLRI